MFDASSVVKQDVCSISYAEIAVAFVGSEIRVADFYQVTHFLVNLKKLELTDVFRVK